MGFKVWGKSVYGHMGSFDFPYSHISLIFFIPLFPLFPYSPYIISLFPFFY